MKHADVFAKDIVVEPFRAVGLVLLTAILQSEHMRFRYMRAGTLNPYELDMICWRLPMLFACAL